MRIQKMKPHSLTYVVSLALGLFLMVIVLLGFLRFANGNIWVAMSLAFLSTLVLSLLLSWVDIQEHEEDKNSDENRYKKYMGRRT